MPQNKELKLTKPSILELRSLTPVFDGLERRRSVLTAEREATRLLLEKMSSRALAEGRPISETERRLLVEGPDSDDLVEDEEPEPHFFEEMVGLLRRSFEEQRDPESRRIFQAACRTVANVDHNLGWTVRRVGLHSPKLVWLLPLRRSGLFLLLAFPGVGALLISVGLLWGAAVGKKISPDMRSTMAVVAVVLSGLGVHLLSVWWKDRR